MVFGDAPDEDETEPHAALRRSSGRTRTGPLRSRCGRRARRFVLEGGRESAAPRSSPGAPLPSAGPPGAPPSAQTGVPPPCRSAFSSRLRASRRSSRSTAVTVTGSPRTSAPTRRPLLGEDGEEVHGLGIAGRVRRIETGRGQQLLDELVELRDIALDTGPPRRITLQQLDRQPDAGKGSAKLVRRPGKDVPLRIDESLDPFRGTVEALREARHLVLAFHLDPRGERARPELVYLRLQPLGSGGLGRGPSGPSPHRDGGGEQHEWPQPERNPVGEPLAPRRRRPSPRGQATVRRRGRKEEPAPSTRRGDDGGSVPLPCATDAGSGTGRPAATTSRSSES